MEDKLTTYNIRLMTRILKFLTFLSIIQDEIKCSANQVWSESQLLSDIGTNSQIFQFQTSLSDDAREDLLNNYTRGLFAPVT